MLCLLKSFSRLQKFLILLQKLGFFFGPNALPFIIPSDRESGSSNSSLFLNFSSCNRWKYFTVVHCDNGGTPSIIQSERPNYSPMHWL